MGICVVFGFKVKVDDVEVFRESTLAKVFERVVFNRFFVVTTDVDVKASVVLVITSLVVGVSFVVMGSVVVVVVDVVVVVGSLQLLVLTFSGQSQMLWFGLKYVPAPHVIGEGFGFKAQK